MFEAAGLTDPRHLGWGSDAADGIMQGRVRGDLARAKPAGMIMVRVLEGAPSTPVESETALTARYRARSLWLDGLAEPLTPRPSLAGDRDCDVAIVGAGFTGLWAAYFLALLQPDLRIVVVEREIAGFGPSGRNGGWASAGLAGSARRYERLRGDDAVRPRRARDGRRVGEIGNVIAAEDIDCGWHHTGTLMVATSAPQVARLHEGIARRRSFGMGEDDLRLLEPAELEARVRVRGARAASFTPHCGRVDPARLARGLAQACERRGVIDLRADPRRVDRARSRGLRRRRRARGLRAARDRGVHGAAGGRAPAASCRSTR